MYLDSFEANFERLPAAKPPKNRTISSLCRWLGVDAFYGRLRAVVDDRAVDDDFADVFVLRDIIHDVEHDIFHDRAQGTGTGFELECLFGNR